MFKIALNAGHGLNTAGKRCLKSIDPNETREWVLNSRICNKIEEKLKAYSGYELIRLDDTTGKTDVALKTRTDKANKFGADFYLAIHHNAGANGKSGGGLETYTYPGTKGATKAWQTDIYNACIKYSGLKGNRSNPIAEKDLHEVRESNMPAVLIECGFMDSTTDTPIILSETFAEQIATACIEVLVKRGGLTKKEKQPYGYVDGASASEVFGWAYDGTDKELEVHIYGYKDGVQVLGIPNVIANVYREDLKVNGIGNGKHGFNSKYNLAEYGDGEYTIKVFAIGGNNPQLTNEYKVVCTANADKKKAEAEERERIEAEKKAEEKRKSAEEIKNNLEEITEEEKKNVLSIFAEFLVKMIRLIFGKKGE